MALTDYRSLYDKDFLGAWDIKGDWTVTITRVKGGELTGLGGRKSKKPVVYIQGTEKGFAVNATNGKTIASMYGNHVEKWVGQRITLYKSMTRNPNGDGDVECIRVRPSVVESAPQKPAPQEPVESPRPPAAPATPAVAGESRTAILDALCKRAGVRLDKMLGRANVFAAEEMADDEWNEAIDALNERIAKRAVA